MFQYTEYFNLNLSLYLNKYNLLNSYIILIGISRAKITIPILSKVS